ncbi:hypothetical protein D5086_016434 [Populus alba]|uniref:Uncharacterized protein n=1 Tax=Populus alba TaxID=43335 RepID=A0ACC4BU53_POPAL
MVEGKVIEVSIVVLLKGTFQKFSSFPFLLIRVQSKSRNYTVTFLRASFQVIAQHWLLVKSLKSLTILGSQDFVAQLLKPDGCVGPDGNDVKP